MLVSLEQIITDTYQLSARVSGLSSLFTVYIIRGSSGVLIEPGPAAVVPDIQAALDKLGLDRLDYIIPTHLHLDHGGGVGELSMLFPSAKVIISPRARKHIIDPSKLIKSTAMAFGKDFTDTYGLIKPVPEERLRVAWDGEIIEAAGHRLKIVHTTGHAPHHIAIFDITTRGLFCGEALGLIYTDGTPPLPAVSPPSMKLDVYLADMERLRKLKPETLLYGHEGVSRNPDRDIAIAKGNTRKIGDKVRDALKRGMVDKDIIGLIDSYIQEEFGFTMDRYELKTNVNGFIHYFKKNILT